MSISSDNKIGNIYIGSKKIGKIYKGGELIYTTNSNKGKDKALKEG